MKTLEKLKAELKDCKSYLKSPLLLEDDEKQEQMELRWHIRELENKISSLIEEEPVEGDYPPDLEYPQ